MNAIYAILAGYALDMLLGDPRWLPHPVVFMGYGIRRLEKLLRGAFPKSETGELWAGRVLAALLPLAGFGLGYGLLWLAGLLHPVAALAIHIWMCYQVFATKELYRQSMAVCRKLAHSPDEARQALGYIVGRDTSALNEAGVIKAAVETVAENTCDGVIAPMIFMAIGGAPLALAYKAINTMDSMVGYKNEKYLHFGRAAARLDDAANLLPSRFSALCMVLAAPLTGLSAAGAWRIWRRDGRNHASPNSAQTEAACAGALGVRLAGDATYAGRLINKPNIGDDIRPVQKGDIPAANRLMIISSMMALALCCGIRFIIEVGI